MHVFAVIPRWLDRQLRRGPSRQGAILEDASVIAMWKPDAGVNAVKRRLKIDGSRQSSSCPRISDCHTLDESCGLSRYGSPSTLWRTTLP